MDSTEMDRNLLMGLDVDREMYGQEWTEYNSILDSLCRDTNEI